jgi:hypothetical protein
MLGIFNKLRKETHCNRTISPFVTFVNNGIVFVVNQSTIKDRCAETGNRKEKIFINCVYLEMKSIFRLLLGMQCSRLLMLTYFSEINR